MALDEVLLLRLKAPLLRVYCWERPAVSFGYFEKFEPIRSRYPATDWVRRWTGGGVVPHGCDFTYSLLVPLNERLMRLRPSDSYRAIHEGIAGVLSRCGSAVSVAARSDEKISRACFENATQHDVLLHGRKIAGAAQRRTKIGLLHQGSIQELSLPPVFGENLAAGFSRTVKEKELNRSELAAAEELATTKYAAEAWTRKF